MIEPKLNSDDVKRIEIDGEKFVVAARRYSDNKLIFFDSLADRENHINDNSDDGFFPFYCEV